MLHWLIEENEASSIDDLLMRPIVPHVVQNGDQSAGTATAVTEEDNPIPSVLPILPLRGVVVYPQTAVPLTIGQARSIWAG